MKSVIILGSSRSQGDTGLLASQLKSKLDCDLIDLSDYDISYYDYKQENRTDDFIGLMKEITAEYEILIFATPVYWYAMSAQMKVFFDRLTDLLEIEKDTGRLLRKMHMAVITSSIGEHLGDEFWLPFERTAEYLGMYFIEGLHTIAGENHQTLLATFAQSISAATTRK